MPDPAGPWRVGIIGAGAMGLAMAERLAGLGHRVRVRDIDPGRETLAAARGIEADPTPAALAAQCDDVIIAVVDAGQTEAVLFGDDGVVRARPLPRCVLLCPTIGPADTERFALALQALGIDALDAPMSGGPQRAREGRMSLMVAAPEAAVERALPLLRDLADPVFRVGSVPGDGARTKLVNNLLAAANLVATAEALALAEAVGLDPAPTLEVIAHSSGQSWIGSDRGRRALEARHAGRPVETQSPLAQTALLAKDSALALAMARAADFDPAMGTLAASAFARACAAGWAGVDDAVMVELRRLGRA
jgi:3-hydroxyisobutyrate dehydrogenase